MAHLKTHSEHGTFVIEFLDSSILDQSEIDSIGYELIAIADRSAGSQVVVDLEDIEFLSSAMIGVFIRFKKSLGTNDSELKLCNARPELMEVLKLTKLDSVFDIHKSRRDAISAFQCYVD